MRPGLAAVLGAAAWGAAVAAWAQPPALPEPLRLSDALSLAREHRPELLAARARARAAAWRPVQAAALPDPEVSGSVDHLPFSMMGADFSVALEQRFPLSGLLGFRGRAAKAEAARLEAESGRAELDVELDAARAFYMLHERRGMARVLAEQQALAKQLVSSATARYSTGSGAQADVLRAQMEAARLESAARAAAAEVRSAEAMLLASLGRPVQGRVPLLAAAVPEEAPLEVAAAVARSVEARPELRAGEAEVQRAEAEALAMRAMNAPMAMVRTGPAYTMADGPGWMLMVGVSVPLWFERNRAAAAEGEAMGEMARADLAAMRRMVEGEAAEAREKVAAARVRYLSLRDEVLPLAARAVEPTLAAYVSGQVPLVSVVETAQALWMAQGEVVMAEAELGLAWVRFERALGGRGAAR